MEGGFTQEGTNQAKIDLLIELLSRQIAADELTVKIYCKLFDVSEEEANGKLEQKKIQARKELYDYIFQEFGTLNPFG